MTNSDAQTIWEADFNPKVKTYWLLSVGFIMAATVVGLPLVPIWFFVGNYFTGRYLSHMGCTLTEKTLEVRKGWFNRVEKTVPLDKITDVALRHGPIMRYYGLRGLSVETAGQSSPGALIRLIGIEDTEAFREAVLAQRDKMIAALQGPESEPARLAPSSDPGATALLTEIRDVLARIERNTSSS